MEGEAGKIRRPFCPAWTWASEKQGTIRKFYGKDMCFQKTLLLEERRIGEQMESCLCSHLVCWLVRSKE